MRISRNPKPSIKGYVIVGNLKVISRGDNVDFPSNPVDDEPMAYLLSSLLDGLKRKPLKVLPNLWVIAMPLPPLFFTLIKTFHSNSY